MGTVVERIKEICDYEGRTVTAFEVSIGASKGVFSRALAQGTDIQSKWIVNVLERYPRYSARWLLTGQGEMISDDYLITLRDGTVYNAAASRDMELSLVETMHKTILTLRTLVETLQIKIDALLERLAIYDKKTKVKPK